MVSSAPKMLDAPEKQTVIAVLIYSCVVFFYGPFFLVIFRAGLAEDYAAISWLEILFHVVNFAVILSLSREYLVFSWWTVGINKGTVAFTIAVSVLVMLGMASDVLWFLPSEFTWVATENVMPIVEASLFMTPVFVATSNPIWGTLSMVLLAPVVTCNIFYATAFTTGYNKKPWLGYLAVTLLAALLAFLNGIIWQDFKLQLIMYLAQLPIHFVCCWAYQKTDTVWTPIIAQAIGNLLVCLHSIFFL